MKKLTILIATILIFALTMSTFAGTFSDVPANHWANEAVQKLVAAGVVEGYPDGTFRGQQNLTRYEIAMIVTQILEQSANEQAVLKSDLVEDMNALESGLIEDINVLEAKVNEELDNTVEAKLANVLDKQENLAEGLTVGQAEDVEAIAKALIAKNQPELPESLTADQAEEVVAVVEKLVGEFAQEIRVIQTNLQAQKKLGTLRYNSLMDKISGNADGISGLDSRINSLENPLINWKAPTYGLSFEDYSATGAKPYLNPFNTDINDDNKDDGKDVFSGTPDKLEQTIGMGLGITTDTLTANLGFTAISEDFFGGTGFNIGVSDLVGTITTDNFSATVKDGQKPTIRSYLVDGNVALDGVVADFNGNTYVLAKNTNTNDDIMAGESTVNLLGKDVNVAVGIEDLAGSGAGRNIVAGFDTSLDFAGFAITPELAISHMKLDERMLKVSATRDSIGPVNSFLFKYQKDTGLVPIAAPKYGFDDGYEVSGAMDIFNLKAKYENYLKSGSYIPALRLDASETFMDINMVFEYDSYLDANASRMEFNADKTFNLGENLSVTGFADWVNMNNKGIFDTNEALYDGDYDGSKRYNSNMFDKGVEASYILGKLETTARINNHINGLLSQKYTATYVASDALEGDITMVQDQSGGAAAGFTNTINVSYDPSDFLSTSAKLVSAPGAAMEHTYIADMSKGIISAGVEKNINTDADSTILTANVDPEAYDVMAISMDPYADFGYRLDNNGDYINYDLGVDASKQINDKLSLNGGYVYGQRQWKTPDYIKADIFLEGIKKAINAGLAYNISDDVDANFDYENMKFDGKGANVADTYEVKKVTGTISVSF